MTTTKQRKKKLIAVASVGGHWVQLLRITKNLEDEYDLRYISTNPKWARLVNKQFYSVPEFSHWNIWKILPSIPRIFFILMKEQPDAVISTGAAPGLLTVLIAKYFFRKKTIWIDSIANVVRLSASGRLAQKFGIDYIYTQWKHLANDKVKFAGTVLGDIRRF